MHNATPPPPVLDMCRVIAYAIVDETVEWTGRPLIFVGNEKLGPVPRLAIACDTTGQIEDVLLLHCSDSWEVQGVSGAPTMESAKARAERAYRGISAKWIETGVTPDAANRWIDENTDHVFCLFCGRRQVELQWLVTKGLGLICGDCINEFYESHQASTGKSDG
jgi:hypothetical protein